MTLMQVTSCRRLQVFLTIKDLSSGVEKLLRLKGPSVVVHTASGFHEGSARALILGLRRSRKETQEYTDYIHQESPRCGSSIASERLLGCLEVVYVLMRNKLIDPQFSVLRMDVLACGSVFATAFRYLITQYSHVVPPFEA